MSRTYDPAVTRIDGLREAIEADALSLARQIARLREIRARREALNAQMEAPCQDETTTPKPAA